MSNPNCKICSQPTQLWLEGLFDDRYGYPGFYNIHHCELCGFAQLAPEPTASEMAAMYTSHYPRQAVTAEGVKNNAVYRGSLKQRIWKWWMGDTNITYHAVTPGDRALDVGCGDGTSLLEMKALGADPHGTEFDENIKPVAAALGLDIHFGDLSTAPWAEHSFDMISMNQLLEHTADPIAFLKLAKRLLKPNGKLQMSFPNVESANRKKTQKVWINWHVPYHVNFFSKDSINRLADATGFTVSLIQTRTPNLWMQLQHDVKDYPGTEGQRNPVWTNKLKPNRMRTLVHLVWFRGLIVPYYRMLDCLGQGDSWFVVLTPKP